VLPAVITSVTQSLTVTASPGVPTSTLFTGFGLPFHGIQCVDARAYTGIKFTVTGDLGTCSLNLTAIISEDNSVDNGPAGACRAGSNNCFSPVSGALPLGTNVVHFASMTAGSPRTTVDAAAINGVQWNLNVPPAGTAAPCVASFSISNVT